MRTKESEQPGKLAFLYFCHVDWSRIKQRPQSLDGESVYAVQGNREEFER